MNITTDNPDITLDQPVLRDRPRCTFALALTTMRGETKRVVGNIHISIPNDRDALPAEPTLLDVVKLVLKRQHPVIEYIAEKNGVLVEGYYEHPRSLMREWSIEYGPNGAAIRMVL